MYKKRILFQQLKKEIRNRYSKVKCAQKKIHSQWAISGRLSSATSIQSIFNRIMNWTNNSTMQINCCNIQQSNMLTYLQSPGSITVSRYIPHLNGFYLAISSHSLWHIRPLTLFYFFNFIPLCNQNSDCKSIGFFFSLNIFSTHTHTQVGIRFLTQT